MRFPPSLRRALSLSLVGAAACSPPPPADPVLVEDWAATTGTAFRQADPRVRARVAALGALAMYEALAAAGETPLRSLSGQVNGLWNVPPHPGRAIDGAIAAAQAQRVVLDSLLGGDAAARAAVDSLAAAHVAARRAVGVAEEMAMRSMSYGEAVGRAVLALAGGDAQRTLVLRHPQECTFRLAARPSGVIPQGEAEAVSAPLSIAVYAAAEKRVIEALASADSALMTGKTIADEAKCVRTLVRGRIRTR